MDQTILDRVNEQKARNAKLAATPGSGFHPDDFIKDTGMHAAPHKRPSTSGLVDAPPPITEHMVAVYALRHVYFVGDCAVKVQKALQDWATERTAEVADGIPWEDADEQKAAALALAAKVEQVDGAPRVTFWKDQFNEVHRALTRDCGLGLCGITENPKQTVHAPKDLKGQPLAL